MLVTQLILWIQVYAVNLTAKHQEKYSLMIHLAYYFLNTIIALWWLRNSQENLRDHPN